MTSDERKGREGQLNSFAVILERYNSKLRGIMRGILKGSLLSLAIGIILIFGANYLYYERGLDELIYHILRDLGIGFVVGASVSIFYERSITLREKALGEMKFEENFATLRGAISQIEQANMELVASKTAESYIQWRLNETFSDEKFKPFVARLLKLMSEAREISSIDKSGKIIEVFDYLSFLNWVIDRYAVHSASKFKQLLYFLRHSETGPVEFCPPDRRTAMLQLLATQVKAMNDGDRYDSLTNAWIYKNMAEDLISATESALQRGLEIRRIFNVCNSDNSEREKQTFPKQLEIIEKQVLRLRTSKNFKCKYLSVGTLNKLDEWALGQCGVNKEDVKKLFFGHFYHISEQQMIRFEPKKMDISTMVINVYSLKENAEQAVKFQNLFDYIWEKCDSFAPSP